jgi:hypothetical protein
MENHQTTSMEDHSLFSLSFDKTMFEIDSEAEDQNTSFASWAAREQVRREEAGTLLSAEETLREDVESFEENYIDTLGNTPEALSWHNLRQNLARGWRRANFYPLRACPHWHHIPTLQEFFHGIPELNLPTNPKFTTLHNSYNDYGNHLKTLKRPDLAAQFQTYRERWVADARLALSGEARAEDWAINLLIEDYKWMLWRFDTLFEDAPGFAEPTAMESQSYLRSAIKLAESGGLSGNLRGEKVWDSLMLAYKKAFRIAWGRDPPEHMDVMLRRPSQMREVENWIYGPGGSLVSTGVTFLSKEQQRWRDWST